MWKSRLGAVGAGMAVVLMSALAGFGRAPNGLAGPGESTRLALLRLPAVQEELKVTAEQKAKVAKIADQAKVAKKEIEVAHGKGKGKGQGQGPDGEGAGGPGAFDREGLEAGLMTLEQESDQALGRVLDAKQRTRLGQIALQLEGPSAFAKPELIRALNMTGEQVELIREILGGARATADHYKASLKQASEWSKDSGGSELEKTRKEQEKEQWRGFAYNLGKSTMPQIGRVLSRKQKQTYDKMLGEPFNFAGLKGPNGRGLFAGAGDWESTLLQMPAIQEELKLTARQKEQAEKGGTAAKVLDPEAAHPAQPDRPPE